MLRRFQILAGLALAALALGATAESFPVKSVRIIVPYAPGGETDAIARLYAAKLPEKWKQPVVVENRAGGGTVIGTDAGAKAEPDGYSILLTSFGFTTNQILVPNLPYDSASLAPLLLIATAPSVLYVNPSVPARNLKEVIEYVKARPKQVMFASSGNASSPHIIAELFASMVGAEITHVPYKGTGPALTDLLGGQVHAIFSSSALMGNARNGKIRAIAVTSPTRILTAPEVPTTAEAGMPNLTAASWWGIFVPVKTPAEIRQRIAADFKELADTPDMRDRVLKAGLEPTVMPREAFAAFLKSELDKWGAIIRARNIRLD